MKIDIGSRDLGGVGGGNHGKPQVITKRGVGRGPADVRFVNGAREKESYRVAVMVCVCVYTKGWARLRERSFRL